MSLNLVAESNDREGQIDVFIDERSRQDLNDFKDYYEKATEDEKATLNEKFKTYLDEELQKDSELRDRLNGSEINESSEISEEDIANLNTVRNLTDVLNNYPNISSPEYRAIKKMIDEHIKDLNDTTEKFLSNLEHQEGDNVDNHD